MAPPALFRQDSSCDPAATILFLVENSTRVEQGWDDFRTQYLEPLLLLFESANEDIPTQVLTLESRPLGGAVPRIYKDSREGLRGIMFNPVDNNKLTVDIIERAAEFLGSVKYRGQRVPSHMVVIAASDPSPDMSDGVKRHPWFLAAQKIVANGALCHLALLKSGQDISPFVGMFQNTLWLQGCQEVPCPFPYDTSKYVFHFCSKGNTSQSSTDKELPVRERKGPTDQSQEGLFDERSRGYPDDYPLLPDSQRRPVGDQNLTREDLMQDENRTGLPGTNRPDSSARQGTGTSSSWQAENEKSFRSIIELPSVPEVPSVPLRSTFSPPPRPSFPSSALRQSPMRARNSSFAEDLLVPRHSDTLSDADDDTEAFWMEGRVVEEAVRRFRRDPDDASAKEDPKA